MQYFILGFIAWLGLIAPARVEAPRVERIESVYKVVEDEQLTATLYLPTRVEAATPLVLFIHGGGWFLRTEADYEDFATIFAINDMAAATIEWRRVPPEGFTDQIIDIKDAIRWLRTHAEELNIDPGRIGIFGSSSGAHLAAMVAFTGDGDGFGHDDPDGPSSAVQAAWLHEGIYDLTTRIGRIEDLIAEVFVGGVSRIEAPEVYRAFSPLFRVTGNEPPTMISYGSEDRTVPPDQPERLERALLDAGVPVERLVLPDLSHGFVFFRPWTRPIMMERLLAYMRETL